MVISAETVEHHDRWLVAGSWIVPHRGGGGLACDGIGDVDQVALWCADGESGEKCGVTWWGWDEESVSASDGVSSCRVFHVSILGGSDVGGVGVDRG